MSITRQIRISKPRLIDEYWKKCRSHKLDINFDPNDVFSDDSFCFLVCFCAPVFLFLSVCSVCSVVVLGRNHGTRGIHGASKRFGFARGQILHYCFSFVPSVCFVVRIFR